MAVPTSVSSQTATHVQQPSVTVDGTASSQIEPDEAVFTIGVSTTSPELDQARRENASRLKSLVTALDEAGIQDDDIRTQNLMAHRDYEWNNRQRIFKGFQVSRNVTVKLRDLERFETVLGAILETTEVDLHGTEFRNSKLRDHDLDIRQKAVEDARRKAAAMAEQLGQSIGRAISIVDSRNPPQPPMMMQARMMSAEAAQGDQPITAPGQIEVRSDVQVTFLLE